MSTKTSPKAVSTRKPSPAKKAPANVGMTLSMRDRAIMEITALGDGDSIIWLDPVPCQVFYPEVIAMQQAGYTTCDTDGIGQCPHCGSMSSAMVTYYRRFRNGKKDRDSHRGFIFCFSCLHVSEGIARFDVNEDNGAAH